MKVYLVYIDYHSYEYSDDVVKVCASEEAAYRYIESCTDGRDYYVEETEVFE